MEYNINDGKKFCFLYLFSCKISWFLVSKSIPLFHMTNFVFPLAKCKLKSNFRYLNINNVMLWYL